jgi:hypothetical protein
VADTLLKITAPTTEMSAIDLVENLSAGTPPSNRGRLWYDYCGGDPDISITDEDGDTKTILWDGKSRAEDTTYNANLTLASTYKLYFYDTGLYIYSSTDGQMDIVADTKLKITAPTTEFSGDISMGTDKIYFYDTGVYIYSSADSTLDLYSDSDIIIDAHDSLGSLYLKVNGTTIATAEAGTWAFGANGAGKDVYFYSDTSGDNIQFDSSEKEMIYTDCDRRMKSGTADIWE